MSQPHSLASRLAYLRWLMGHIEELPLLWAIYGEFQTAGDLQGKWDALKKAGDLLVAMAADFPNNAAATRIVSAADYEAAVADLAATRGLDPTRLTRLAEFLETWLPIVLRLLRAA